MSAAIEDNLDQFIKTIGTFQSMKGSLDAKFYNGLKTIVNDAMKQVSDHTGEYMCNLRKHQPDEETLQKIIANVPSSLSYEDEYGTLPIYSASESKESVHYVPLLAKEGAKHNVGGDDARGGLMLLGHNNVLQLLAFAGGHIDADPLYLDIMKKLREFKLFLREDIQDHDLFYYACNPKTPMRFQYFIDWCPEGLKTYTTSMLQTHSSRPWRIRLTQSPDHRKSDEVEAMKFQYQISAVFPLETMLSSIILTTTQTCSLFASIMPHET